MIVASHYVIRDILYTAKTDDPAELEKICRKYTKRYKNDEKLAEVCDFAIESIEKETFEEKLTDILVKLEELLSVRKVSTSGGTDLWHSNRRKFA